MEVENLSVLEETLEQCRQFEVRNQMQSGSAHVVSDTQSTQLTERPRRGYRGREKIQQQKNLVSI